jgi:uncharacterized Tic20 family protein
MRRTITKLLILAALANILFGLVVLIGRDYTIVPVIVWLRSFQEQQLDLLISFAAKCEIAIGLAFLIAAAILGRRLIPK